jgi:hypothetical protein
MRNISVIRGHCNIGIQTPDIRQTSSPVTLIILIASLDHGDQAAAGGALSSAPNHILTTYRGKSYWEPLQRQSQPLSLTRSIMVKSTSSQFLLAALVAPLVLASPPGLAEMAKRAACTVSSAAEVKSISSCLSVVINAFTVPSGSESLNFLR